MNRYLRLQQRRLCVQRKIHPAIGCLTTRMWQKFKTGHSNRSHPAAGLCPPRKRQRRHTFEFERDCRSRRTPTCVWPSSSLLQHGRQGAAPAAFGRSVWVSVEIRCALPSQSHPRSLSPVRSAPRHMILNCLHRSFTRRDSRPQGACGLGGYGPSWRRKGPLPWAGA